MVNISSLINLIKSVIDPTKGPGGILAREHRDLVLALSTSQKWGGFEIQSIGIQPATYMPRLLSWNSNALNKSDESFNLTLGVDSIIDPIIGRLRVGDMLHYLDFNGGEALLTITDTITSDSERWLIPVIGNPLNTDITYTNGSLIEHATLTPYSIGVSVDDIVIPDDQIDSTLPLNDDVDYAPTLGLEVLTEVSVASNVTPNLASESIDLGGIEVESIISQLDPTDTEVTAKLVNTVTGGIGYLQIFTSGYIDATTNDQLFIAPPSTDSNTSSSSSSSGSGGTVWLDEFGDTLTDISLLPEDSNYELFIEVVVAVNPENQQEYNIANRNLWEKALRSTPTVTNEITSGSESVITSGSIYDKFNSLETFISQSYQNVNQGRRQSSTFRTNYQAGWVDVSGLDYDTDAHFVLIQGVRYLAINLNADIFQTGPYSLSSTLKMPNKIVHLDALRKESLGDTFYNSISGSMEVYVSSWSGYINTTPITSSVATGLHIDYSLFEVVDFELERVGSNELRTGQGILVFEEVPIRVGIGFDVIGVSPINN